MASLHNLAYLKFVRTDGNLFDISIHARPNQYTIIPLLNHYCRDGKRMRVAIRLVMPENKILWMKDFLFYSILYMRHKRKTPSTISLLPGERVSLAPHQMLQEPGTFKSYFPNPSTYVTSFHVTDS